MMERPRRKAGRPPSGEKENEGHREIKGFGEIGETERDAEQSEKACATFLNGDAEG